MGAAHCGFALGVVILVGSVDIFSCLVRGLDNENWFHYR